MDQIELENLYTFLAVRSDGGVPAMEIRPCLDDEAAIHAAGRWLREHASCVSVEVWRDGKLLAKIGAAPFDAGPQRPVS